MINPQVLETFGNYDKKSLMAGVVVGQGLKGRARAPRTPAPAGFPQGLWDDAVQRANNMIASMQGAGQSAGTPETPDDWQFDKDAFCFGIAAGRSLEGWEIDGMMSPNNPSNWAKIMYYIHLDSSDTVYINVTFGRRNGIAYIDWGDESSFETFTPGYVSQYSHSYQSGDYIIALCSDCSMRPTHGEKTMGAYYWGGVYGASNDSYYNLKTLRGAYLEGNIPFIGEGAFRNCINLLHITIPDGVTSIGEYAFHTCKSLTSVTIPDSVTSIEDFTFTGCHSLSNVTIPDGVTSIGNFAFGACVSLTSVTIPASVTRIGSFAFHTCLGLTSVIISDGVTEIGNYAFWHCESLTSVTIPASVTRIEDCAFEYSIGLTSVIISDGVTEIGDSAFWGCKSLTSVTIPASVTRIEGLAFFNTLLTLITINRNALVVPNAFPPGCTINYYD